MSGRTVAEMREEVENNRDIAYEYYLRIRTNPSEMIELPSDVIRTEIINHFSLVFAMAPTWLFYPLYPFGYLPEIDSSETSID
jgi:hypothetical protein